MVWGVCRRFLHNHHDAEDAFQATFLVFLRKAESIFPRDLVGNWLYGVAYQTALNARGLAAKRKQQAAEVKDTADPIGHHLAEARDEQRLLDQELCRLPANYRAVIVLCELEGQTRKEAARQLKVPEGTVAGWLARARAMLAKRLSVRLRCFSRDDCGSAGSKRRLRRGAQNVDGDNHQGCKPACSRTKRGRRFLTWRRRTFRRSDQTHVHQQIQGAGRGAVRPAVLHLCHHRRGPDGQSGCRAAVRASTCVRRSSSSNASPAGEGKEAGRSRGRHGQGSNGPKI